MSSPFRSTTATWLHAAATVGVIFASISLFFSIVLIAVSWAGSGFLLGDNDFDPVGILIVLIGGGSVIGWLGFSALALVCSLPGLFRKTSRRHAILGVSLVVFSVLILAVANTVFG